MKFTIADQPMHWRIWGDEAADKALMIHCSLASSGAWRGVADGLKDQLHMFAIDLPGHGESGDWDGTGDYFDLCSTVSIAFLEEPAHLIAHSFGAVVALRLAVTKPEMVKSLTLIEPVLFAAAKVFDPAEHTRHEASFAPFGEAIEAGDKDKMAELFMASWGAGVSWRDTPEKQRAYITERIGLIPASHKALSDDTGGILEVGMLEKVTCPVLLLEGVGSPPIIASIQQALETRLPNATRVCIKGAAHMVPITHPAQTVEAITALINRARGPENG